MNTMKLTPPAQRLVLAKINRCFDDLYPSMEDMSKMLDLTPMTLRSAVESIEQHGLASRFRGHGQHCHKTFLDWHYDNRRLWDAAKDLMTNPLVRHYRAAEDQNLDGFHPIDEGLLIFPGKPHDVRPTPRYVHRDKSRTQELNETLVNRTTLSKGRYIVEFWKYPPLLPGLKKLDNLSLWVASLGHHGLAYDMYRCSLEGLFDWRGDGHIHYLRTNKLVSR